MANNRTSQALQPGDLVQPRSGGTVMKVTRVLDGRIEVQWSAHCQVQVRSFAVDALRKVTSEPPGS